MSLKNIYHELSKHYDAEYYTKLAKSNAMVVPVLIDIISDDYFEFDKRQAEIILENISKTDSELVYPYFDYLCDMVDREENPIFWSMLKIISNLLSCDYLDKWNNKKEIYFNALNSNAISKFSIACSCAVNVVKHKVDDAERVIKVLTQAKEKLFNNNSDFVMIASEIANETLKTIENEVSL